MNIHASINERVGENDDHSGTARRYPNYQVHGDAYQGDISQVHPALMRYLIKSVLPATMINASSLIALPFVTDISNLARGKGFVGVDTLPGECVARTYRFLRYHRHEFEKRRLA